MLSVHFNGHGKDHPEALGRSLREQLDEAFGALGFIRHGGTAAPAVSPDNLPSPAALLAIQGEINARHEADTPDPAQNVAAAEPAAEAPKRRGRPPKAAEPEKTPEPEPQAAAEPQPESAPQISVSPEDRKPDETAVKSKAELLEELRQSVRDTLRAAGEKFGIPVVAKHGRAMLDMPAGVQIKDFTAEQCRSALGRLKEAMSGDKFGPEEAELGDLG